MIDLSFEYGCTPRELSHRLMPGDIVELQQYANKYQLPSRRNELLLAQISKYIAMTMGGAKAGPLSDYMPYRPETSIEEMTVEEIRAMNDFQLSD